MTPLLLWHIRDDVLGRGAKGNEERTAKDFLPLPTLNSDDVVESAVLQLDK